MNDVYFDSNFLVKLYRREADSQRAQSTLHMLQGEAIVSELTDIEVIAVLMRNLPRTEANIAVSKYKAQRALGLFGYVAFDENTLARGTRIAEQFAKPYSLRSLDILHLAISLRHGIPAIASFDQRLRTAAQALGLAVLPA